MTIISKDQLQKAYSAIEEHSDIIMITSEPKYTYTSRGIYSGYLIVEAGMSILFEFVARLAGEMARSEELFWDEASPEITLGLVQVCTANLVDQLEITPVDGSWFTAHFKNVTIQSESKS